MSDSTTTTFHVEGMTCGHCVRHVTKALEAVPGVSRSEVDLDRGRATVEHDPSVTAASLIAALADAGYDAATMPRTP